MNALPAYLAALVSGGLGVAVVLRRRRSLAAWSFFVGMLVLAAESVLNGLSLGPAAGAEALHWHRLSLFVEALLPAPWLAFSLTYSRGNAGEFLRRWRIPLIAALVVPVAIAVVAAGSLARMESPGAPGGGWWLAMGGPAKVLKVAILLAYVGVLTNIEKTFRAAIGTMQWRMKFVAIGAGVIFGARIYTGSQAILYSGHDMAPIAIEIVALLIGCVFISIAFIRQGFAEVDVYPSGAVLHGSVTVVLVGGYLLVIGLLAQVVGRFGGVGSFRVQAFLVLLGLAMLAVLLLSQRLRQAIRQFVSRHFSRPHHDFRRIWMLFTQRLSGVMEPGAYAAAAARLISETFNVLSVTLWTSDANGETLSMAASTSRLDAEGATAGEIEAEAAGILAVCRREEGPFDLDRIADESLAPLREASAAQFRAGGNRIGVPLMAGSRCLGVAVLTDRVNGMEYTVEDLDLLKCIGNEAAFGLLRLRLTDDLVEARELRAFQSLSAFFVHDLKNAASTLSLMLQNLKVHFDNPAFRSDALRAISSTADHINELIARLGMLRRAPELTLAETDLNELVAAAIAALDGGGAIEWVREFGDLPTLEADREQIGTVVTNLLINAREAIGAGGRITVATRRRDDRAVLTVTDDGCGMTPEFLKDSLFRPFQTTKKKGLGIGMFQSRMIVEAHHGVIQVESQPGQGTTFRITLPLKPEDS